jgi:hypothetical protein
LATPYPVPMYLMIAVAGGAVVPEFGLPPKTVLTILAMFSFGVVSARPAVVRAEGARGVAVTLALGAGREVPPEFKTITSRN